MGELVRGLLEVGDPLPERGPFLDVVDGPGQDRLGGSLTGDRNAESFQRKTLLQIVKSVSDLTEQVALGDEHAVEEELRRVLRVQDNIVQFASAGEARNSPFTDRKREGGGGAGEDDEQMDRVDGGERGRGR